VNGGSGVIEKREPADTPNKEFDPASGDISKKLSVSSNVERFFYLQKSN
jgi:hypothetical protein